ncbi:unnamed protein product [Lampetra planeri]
MQTTQGVAMGLISGIVFLTFIAMVENNACEEKGQYNAAKGFCCQLCPAGTRLLYDCDSDGDHSLCTTCVQGKDYMDVENRDPACKKCSTCNALYEDVQQDCTPTSDTVCRCKDGYSRIRLSQHCAVKLNTEQTILIPAGIVIFVVLMAVVLGIVMYRKKTHRYPFNVTQQETETSPLLLDGARKSVLEKLRKLIKKQMKSSDAEVWRQLHTLLPEVYNSISENTFFVLYEMHIKYNIELSVYWKAYEIDNAARAALILKYSIRAGEEMCNGLLEMIHAGQDKRTQLKTLLDTAVKCSPTLNPDTAHIQLLISSDRKTVSWIHNPLYKNDHPDRFDHWTYVLSFESFSAGCHCWVVNVGDVDQICVGVAYERIPRKGGDSACLMGLNSMSWCLRKYDNNYRAWHDKQCTELQVGQHLRRIGVGLDYDAGVLIFYNADNNQHLHTFYARFSQPLHVNLSVWNHYLTIEPVNND